jgi:MYXO-CTERM domain-containing protein
MKQLILPVPDTKARGPAAALAVGLGAPVLTRRRSRY